MKNVSIFIPAYNAALHIQSVISRIPKDLWDTVQHVWIVNDGSTDATRKIVDTLCRENNKIKAIHFSWNRGYGKAVSEGLACCKTDNCDFAICLHADGQYPPEPLFQFIQEMTLHKIDILQGSRIASGTALSGGMPLYKFVANRILTFFENIIFNLHMSDFHSGMLLYSKKALDTIPLYSLSKSFDFDLEVIALARANNLCIAERPIPTRYAQEISHLNPITYGLRVIRVMCNFIRGKYHKK